MQQSNANVWLDDHDPCSLNNSLNAALFHASSATLPTHKFTARRPWISLDTFILIDQRDLARADGDFYREANFVEANQPSCEIRQSALARQCNCVRRLESYQFSSSETKAAAVSY